MDAAPRLRINLLGELTASYDNRPLDLGGRRQRAVLAVLLLARGEVVPAEKLADAVWSARTSRNASGALQSYVSHLRRSLQPDAPARGRSAIIVREGPGYAVRQPVEAVDAWHFEALLAQAEEAESPGEAAALLRESLGLWRGPALAEYADEPWAEAEIARLTELRSLARERLLAARLGMGESAILVPELEALVAEDHLREERWRLLSLALYRAHRQADALAALRRARETLADELGVDPGPALRRLEAEVLAQSPTLDLPRRGVDTVASGGSTTSPTGAAPAPGTRDLTPTPSDGDLLDRERELAALKTVVDDFATGGPRLLLIEGPAGIGKTRLLERALNLAAHRSARVLAARGSPLESAYAFGVVRQLFEPVVAAPDDQELLSGAAASARGVFDPAADGTVDGSYALLHGLFWVTVNLTEPGPVVLAVDDAQWCDTASLRFLAYLARRLTAVPVLLVVGLRTDEEHEDQDLLAELSLEPGAVVLRPKRLTAAATAALVERRLGTPPAQRFTDACHQTTSGNPLLLDQLLRALHEDGVRPDASHADSAVAVGSRAVSSMVLLRLRRLPEGALEVARAAALLGDGAPLPAVAAVAGLSETRTATALAVLTRAGIVRDEQPVAFAHPLVREAVYQALPSAERGLWHERAAEVLHAHGASEEQVAAHLLLAPARGSEVVVGLLRSAASCAAGRGAPDSALTYLRRALAESETGPWRQDVLMEMGLLETMLDGSAAVDHLLEVYRTHDDPRVRADMAVVIARTQVFASEPGVATAFAREAEAALPDDLTDHRQGLIALQRMSGFMHGVEDGWTTPAPDPTGDGPGALMLAAVLALGHLIEGTDRDRAVALARFALREDRLLSVDDGLFWVVATDVRMLADDDIGDFWSRARAMSQARGSLFAALSTSLWEGLWHWRRGELHEALGCLSTAHDQDRMWGGIRVGDAFIRAFEIGCHLDRGDLAAARAVADAPPVGPLDGEGARVLRQAVAGLLVAEGSFEEALARLDADPATIPMPNPVWNPWRSIRAAALHGLGRTPEAVALAEEEVALLRAWGSPTDLGRGLRLRGELRGDAGTEDLREAVDLLASTPSAVHLAGARCALGSRPQIADDEAVPLLRAAHETARQRGAAAVAERARAALASRGHPTEPAAPAETGQVDVSGSLSADGSSGSQVRHETMTRVQARRTV